MQSKSSLGNDFQTKPAGTADPGLRAEHAAPFLTPILIPTRAQRTGQMLLTVTNSCTSSTGYHRTTMEA